MIGKIACNLGVRDEEPNIRLAEELVKSGDTRAIAEIVAGLSDPRREVASDCVKVLYEIGYRDRSLIADYAETFMTALGSKNNRLVWGACIALAQIAELRSDYLFSEFDALLEAYAAGSAIAVDNCVSIFAGIASSNREYMARVFSVIVRHLETCRPKEVGQHAERAFICVDAKNAREFKAVLLKRYGSLAEAQKRRIDRLLKRIEKDFPAT